MYISTHEKKIKVHTLVLDDSEVDHYLEDPEALTNLLHDLLVRQPESNGVAPKKKSKKRSAPSAEELIECPKCGMLVKPRGLLLHQRGSKCKPKM